MIFQGSRTCIARKPYIFVIVQGGGGGSGPPVPPPLDPCMGNFFQKVCCHVHNMTTVYDNVLICKNVKLEKVDGQEMKSRKVPRTSRKQQKAHLSIMCVY